MAVFAKVGQSLQQYDGVCPEGWITMKTERTDPTFVALATGKWGLPDATEKEYEVAVQNHLDSAAKLYGYDNIINAVTYAEEPAVTKFQKDGKAFRAWRSLVWDYCYTQLAAVEAGNRTQPTVKQFLFELPALGLQGPTVTETPS